MIAFLTWNLKTFMISNFFDILPEVVKSSIVLNRLFAPALSLL